MELEINVFGEDISANTESENLNVNTTQENIVDASIEKQDIIDCSVKEKSLTIQSDNVVVVGGSEGGTTDHSKLNNLNYENSGHTGFASKKDVYSKLKVWGKDYEFNNNQELSDFFLYAVDTSITNLQNQVDDLNQSFNLLIQDLNRVLEDVLKFISENFLSKNEAQNNYYTKTEIDNIISSIQNARFEIITALPSNPETNVIYLKPAQDNETNNYYEEYIYINNAWEMIGTTKVNLSGYATENWVNTAIKDLLTAEQINTLITNALKDYIKIEELDDKINENLPTFNRDFNIKNEDGIVKTFTNTGSSIDDKYIFTQGLPAIRKFEQVIFTTNEVTILYGVGTNTILISKNGIDFEHKTLSYTIINIIRLVYSNRLVAFCTGGWFAYSDDDGSTWEYAQNSNFSSFTKIFNYLEYTDTFAIANILTKKIATLNNQFTQSDNITSTITPNFMVVINNSQLVWCDYNGNCKYKAGSREATMPNLPTGRINLLKKVNGVTYAGYSNDNKIAYLNGTSPQSGWLTYSLPETCTVNDIVYNAKDQTYYILTDINTYYKTKDFLTFENFDKDNIRIYKAEMTLVGLMGVSNEAVNYVFVAPTQQKIEDTLQELKRAVNKERWVGNGLKLDGETISIKANDPLLTTENGISLKWGSVDAGYLLPEVKTTLEAGGNYRHNVDANTIADEIWSIWEGEPNSIINVMFIESGTFFDPMSWDTEYTVEKGDYGYFVTDEFGMSMPFFKMGSFAPFLN